ncbi:MAG TPA: PadR family transcriptional regulator [Stellaceae bacterium]|nr:PadR family transcriptional regulator [Stellaceae bacterium]
MGDGASSFTSGIPELLVLRLIQEREMYGYELVQAIRDRSDDAIAFGEGVIYPLLHALEQGGALSSRRKSVNGRSRVYYVLTAAGARRLADLASTWTRLADAVRTILSGEDHALAL